MTEKELLMTLHQYTPWELLHLQHLNEIQNMERFNNSSSHPIEQEEKIYGLHLPLLPDSDSDTYSEESFFKFAPNQEIMITQHDRYTPPVLHKHDFFELLYVYEGEFTQQINAKKMIMRTGDFCLIPPDVYHSLDVCNYSIVLNILIPKSVFQAIFLNNLHGDNVLSTFFLGNVYSKNINDYIIFHTNGDMTIRNIIFDMCMEAINKEDYFNHIMKSYLLILFGLLLRNYEATCDFPATKMKNDIQNFEIIQYLEKNYKTITLQEIADAFHYSSQHMSHRIRQLTGTSFSQYLLQKRMQEASNLLINTNIKIADIGENIGYQNPEHFIRTFKKYYGTSPNSYRLTHNKTV